MEYQVMASIGRTPVYEYELKEQAWSACQNASKTGNEKWAIVGNAQMLLGFYENGEFSLPSPNGQQIEEIYSALKDYADMVHSKSYEPCEKDYHLLGECRKLIENTLMVI